jgi:hypothetical protein
MFIARMAQFRGWMMVFLMSTIKSAKAVVFAIVSAGSA